MQSQGEDTIPPGTARTTRSVGAQKCSKPCKWTIQIPAALPRCIRTSNSQKTFVCTCNDMYGVCLSWDDQMHLDNSSWNSANIQWASHICREMISMLILHSAELSCCQNILVSTKYRELVSNKIQISWTKVNQKLWALADYQIRECRIWVLPFAAAGKHNWRGIRKSKWSTGFRVNVFENSY